MQGGYVQTDGSGLYSNNSFSSAPSTVKGPYNLYGLSTINLGNNATLLIESNIKGAPTILTNTFSFVNNLSESSTNTRLLLSSPLTITSDTVGGFGNIISYLDTLFTLNVPDSSNGRVVTTFANTWTLPLTSTGHLSLSFLSDAVITNPTDLSSGVFGGGNIYI